MGYPTYWTDDKEACVKPTGCGDPTNIFFIVCYLGLVFLTYFTGRLFQGASLLYNMSWVLVFLCIIILSIIRIVCACDLWINMDEWIFLLVRRAGGFPFSIAFLKISLSWLRMGLVSKYLLEKLFIRCLNTFKIISYIFALIVYIFSYVLTQLQIVPFAVAPGVCFALYIYIGVVLAISAKIVISNLNYNFSRLYKLYRRRICLNLSISSTAIFFRAIMNVCIYFLYDYINTQWKFQIVDIVQNIICELIPFYLTLILLQMHVKKISQKKDLEIHVNQHNERLDCSSIDSYLEVVAKRSIQTHSSYKKSSAYRSTNKQKKSNPQSPQDTFQQQLMESKR